MYSQVAIFLPSRCTNVPKELDGDGAGPREQVADWLAYQLAGIGCDVHVFTSVPESTHVNPTIERGAIHYVNMEMAAPMLTSYDWDACVTFDYANIAMIPGIKDHVKTLVMAQNYFSAPPNGDCDPLFYSNIDKWIYPSFWAADECSKISGAPESISRVIPYTWDQRFFPVDREGKGNRFIYASQTESGLAQMLKLWPTIRENHEDAILTIATEAQEFVDQIQWSHHYQSQLALDIRDNMNQDGVRYVGRLGRAALAREMAEADALLYPAEPLMPAETGSLPLIQAAASGAIPVFTEVDALEELYGRIGHSEEQEDLGGDFVAGVDEALHFNIEIPRSRTPEKIFADWKVALGC